MLEATELSELKREKDREELLLAAVLLSESRERADTVGAADHSGRALSVHWEGRYENEGDVA